MIRTAAGLVFIKTYPSISQAKFAYDAALKEASLLIDQSAVLSSSSLLVNKIAKSAFTSTKSVESVVSDLEEESQRLVQHVLGISFFKDLDFNSDLYAEIATKISDRFGKSKLGKEDAYQTAYAAALQLQEGEPDFSNEQVALFMYQAVLLEARIEASYERVTTEFTEWKV